MRTTLTSGKLDAADDDNDEQSEDFSDSENILDPISPVDKRQHSTAASVSLSEKNKVESLLFQDSASHKMYMP